MDFLGFPFRHDGMFHTLTLLIVMMLLAVTASSPTSDGLQGENIHLELQLDPTWTNYDPESACSLLIIRPAQLEEIKLIHIYETHVDFYNKHLVVLNLAATSRRIQLLLNLMTQQQPDNTDEEKPTIPESSLTSAWWLGCRAAAPRLCDLAAASHRPSASGWRPTRTLCLPPWCPERQRQPMMEIAVVTVLRDTKSSATCQQKNNTKDSFISFCMTPTLELNFQDLVSHQIISTSTMLF